MPQVTELVSDLKVRIEKLSILKGSLEAMRQVAMAYQREVVTTTLGALEDSINHFLQWHTRPSVLRKITIGARRRVAVHLFN